MILKPKVASRAPFPAHILSWLFCLTLLTALTLLPTAVSTPLFAQDEETETESADESPVETEGETDESSDEADEPEEGEEAEAESDEAEEEDDTEAADEEDEEEDTADDEAEGDEADADAEEDEGAADDEAKAATTGSAAKTATDKPAAKQAKVRKSSRVDALKTNKSTGTQAKKRTMTLRDREAQRKQKRLEKLRKRNQEIGAKKRKEGPKKVVAPKKKQVAKKEPAKQEKKAEPEGFLAWFQANKVLALGTLWGGFFAVAGFVYLLVFRRRKSPAAVVVGVDLSAEEYDATEAKTEKIDVDDKSYALVVDEEELELPPTPEEKRKSAEMRRIQKARTHQEEIERLVERGSFDRAFDRYLEHLDSDEPLRPDRELTLGKHFLQNGDLDKASRIFEHFINTQPESEIEPEVFFNLGYIHFKSNTLRKSKDYFERFAEIETRPERVERARSLVRRLEKVQNLN